MQLRDNGLRFSPITIALHWIIASLLFAIVALWVAKTQIAEPSTREGISTVMNLLSLLLCVSSIYRFWARITTYHPLPLGTPNPVEVIVSRSVAAGMALAMILLPIATWSSMWTAGEVVTLPYGFSIPSLIPPNHQLKDLADLLFNIGATVFTCGMLLHVFGALKNHFALRNDVLRRMLGKRVEI